MSNDISSLSELIFLTIGELDVSAQNIQLGHARHRGESRLQIGWADIAVRDFLHKI